jgi:hypothetical protein
MKNKYISYFINSFAAIGFFVVACSVADSSPADSPDDNPPIVQSNIGKYQVSAGANYTFNVINTETGQVKVYYISSNSLANNPVWSLASTINTQ